MPRALHRRHHRPRKRKSPLHVRGKHAMKILERVILNRFLYVNPRIVDQNRWQPVALLILFTNAGAAARSVTSYSSGDTLAPSFCAASSSTFTRRPVITTRAPAAARHEAIAKPRPVPPPV